MANIPLNLGGGSGGASSLDTTASSAHVLAGYTAITSDSDDEPKEGTIKSKSAATYNTSTSDQSVTSGQYLSGAQTIKAVTTSNITAGNIKKGVVATVGDANSATRIANVTGSYTTVSSGQSAVTAAVLTSGYSAFANGGAEVKGAMKTKAAATYNTSASDQSVAAAQYLSGAQTIKGVSLTNASAGNLKKGVVGTIGDTGSATRLVNATGTYTTPSSGQAAVTAGTMLSGYSAFVNGGNEIKGTLTGTAGTTYNTSTSDQTIASGKYYTSAVTIKAVTTSNISAGNIKKGAVIKVGDANSATRIHNVTGTYTTPSSGQSAITAANMASGYSAFVNGGAEIKGTATGKAAATYNTSASDQSIAANQWITGTQTIKAVKTANITAANIKKGAVIKVGDANSATRIHNVTGTYTTISSGQTAVVAAKMASGYSAFANGGAEVKGSVTKQAAKTWTPTTSNQTIAEDVMIVGTQTISGDANLVAANIASGVSIFGVTGSFQKYKSWTGTYKTTSTRKTFTTSDSASVSWCYVTTTSHAITPTGFAAHSTNGGHTLGYDGTYFCSASGYLVKITGEAKFAKASIVCPTYATSYNQTYTMRVVGY